MSSLIHFYYNPLNNFERLFDDAFDVRFRPSLCTAKVRRPSTNVTQHLDSLRPRMDVKESKDLNLVTATFEVPGLKSEEIAIELQENRLTVSGESTTLNAVEEDGYAVRERRAGKFSRTLQLPFGTKPEDVTAKLENGLLTVTFPKPFTEQQPQRISIQ